MENFTMMIAFCLLLKNTQAIKLREMDYGNIKVEAVLVDEGHLDDEKFEANKLLIVTKNNKKRERAVATASAKIVKLIRNGQNDSGKLLKTAFYDWPTKGYISFYEDDEKTDKSLMFAVHPDQPVYLKFENNEFDYGMFVSELSLNEKNGKQRIVNKEFLQFITTDLTAQKDVMNEFTLVFAADMGEWPNNNTGGLSYFYLMMRVKFTFVIKKAKKLLAV